MAWLAGSSQISIAGAQASPPESSGKASAPHEPSHASSPSTAPAEPAARSVRPIKAEFDLIVVGGGISGTTAAISAARNGVKVALVHERSMLGGNSSSEVRLYPEGNDAYQPWIKESGIHEEFHLEDRVRNHVEYREGLMNCHWDLVLYEWAMREKNLSLFLNTHMHEAVMSSPGHIGAIRAIQLGTEKSFELSAPLFVDATGDGVLGYRCGADFRWGREGQSEYNESLAPPQADQKVMGNTLFFRAFDVGHPVPFKRPDWAAEFKTEKDLSYRTHKNVECGYWWIEVGAPLHPIKDNEAIRHEALRQLLGVWDHIKNKGDHGAENYALDFVGFWPYKRESRRIIGDSVLTQQHVQDPHPLADAVAYGAWGIDIHIQGGIHARHERPYIPPHGKNFELLGTLPYGIGLRSLYSRNIENLMMAGRPISASYVAFCSSRVLSTGCIVGQAVGAAAGLCRKYQTTPRDIAGKHAHELQQLILRQDGHIPGVANEDPQDLARSATAIASSESPLEFPQPVHAYELSSPKAQLFPVSGDRIDTIAVRLRSRRPDPASIEMGLRPAEHVWDFRADRDIATAKASVAPGQDGWVEFAFNAKVEPRRLYWIHLPAAEGIDWFAIDVPRAQPCATPIGASAAQKLGKTRWEQLGIGHCYALKLTPPSRPYGAQNINHGTHRPDRWSNIWISAPKLPAEVELQWPQPLKFNTVLLTFDTNTGRRETEPLFRYPDCVKDYELQARMGGSWRTIESVKDNYFRRREHTFEAVEADRLRLRVLATNGAPTARVYEVRVYEQA
jgi:hypothetical protein